jgi:TDG/mug DNA glycosylase family protein
VDRATVDCYETRAREWETKRGPGDLAWPRRFGAAVAPGARRLDLGCGPGWHAAALGTPLVALDAAAAMCDLARTRVNGLGVVCGDLECLPFRSGSFGGVWAHKCLMHIPMERVPSALAELYRITTLGAPLHLRISSERLAADGIDEFAGRHFARWPIRLAEAVVEGGGFAVEAIRDDGVEWLDIEARRVRSLPDTVGPGMRMLIVGLNPSEYSADAGVPFARSNNRFWPALEAAGLGVGARDPRTVFDAQHIGFTDLVKRATPRASQLQVDEYSAGFARLERLCEWLRPAVVCFAGLGGYRAARDRSAATGPQAIRLGGARVYVMPNPSGANAHVGVADLARHLREAYDAAS